LNVDSLARLVISLACLQSYAWMAAEPHSNYEHVNITVQWVFYVKVKLLPVSPPTSYNWWNFNCQFFPNLVIYLSNFYHTSKFIHIQHLCYGMFIPTTQQESYEKLWKAKFFTLHPNYWSKLGLRILCP